MKIAAKAAPDFQKNPRAQALAALIYGPDSGLVRDTAKQIIAGVLGENPDPLALFELSEAGLLTDPALLSDELNAISLMAPERVLYVRGATDKLAGLVQDVLPALNKHAFLLITADELNARSKLRLLFEDQPTLAAIACYKDEARDIAAIARARLEEAGIRIDRDTLDYLAAQLGSDRYVTYQELDKLITYAGPEKALSAEDVRLLVDYNRETELDDIASAVAGRNMMALDINLERLNAQGQNSVAILRALTRHFNRLYMIVSRAGAGESISQIIANLRPKVFFKTVPELTRQAESWSASALARALEVLLAAELAAKSNDTPPAAIARKLLQISQLR